MNESSNSGLAFNLFKSQSNNDFKDLIKVLPSKGRKLSFPPCVQDFVKSLLDSNIIGNEIQEILNLSEINPTDEQGVLIIISPSDKDTIESVCQFFQRVPNYTKALLIIPRTTAFIQQVLDYHNFIPVQSCPSNPSKEIYIQDFHADFLPIDNDFFLMPCVNSFYQISIENDFNDLYSSARCLSKIQMVFGAIPQIFTLGYNAERVRDLMQGIISQTSPSSSTMPQIDSLIIIDRSADLISPLMTYSIIESLFDETIGIDYGVLHVPESIGHGEQRIVLNDYANIYQKIRFSQIPEAISVIKTQLGDYKETNRILKEKEYKIDNFKENIYKMNSAIENKPKVNLLLDVINASIDLSVKKDPLLKIMVQKEFDLVISHVPVIDFAENYITIFNDWMNALRLIFLESMVGIANSKGTVQKIEKEIVMEFGLKSHEVIIALEKLKLLSSNTIQGWQQLSDALGVFKKDKLCELCNNFVPPTVRAVEKATIGDWPGAWGKVFEERKVPVSVVGKPVSKIDGEVRKILVFFVGGVTLSEAAFIRQMGNIQFGGQVQYIVGSTDAINKTKMMSQICPGFFK